MKKKRLLVVQAAALGYELLKANDALSLDGLSFRPIESVFPALTCPVQATLRTGLPPAEHGVVGNGFLFRDLGRPQFWEQSSALAAGARIWAPWRARGNRVGMLFWQQSLGESVDCLLSPQPVHKHGGGLIDACYSLPRDLYATLGAEVGRRFSLARYWGPLASTASSKWIAEATVALLGRKDLAPHLCFTYLPALDYDLQRYGPDHKRARSALGALLRQLKQLLVACSRQGYELVIVGDYAMGSVTRPVFPNLALRDAGLLALREVRGMRYPDFFASRAFAVVDHEVAHVYVRDPADLEPVRLALERLEGVGEVAGADRQRELGLAHPRSGELVLIAADGAWFAYPWWRLRTEQPDYAGHVDIHNKPGYDPGELFFGWPPGTTSQSADRIRGSHGKIGGARAAAWATTCRLPGEPAGMADLAGLIRAWLEAE